MQRKQRRYKMDEIFPSHQEVKHLLTVDFLF
jgi:hypothetical protein